MKVLLVSYDNDSYMTRFPTGLGYIASTLLREGHEVEIYAQDIEHYPDEHLTKYLDENHFDVIGIGVIGGYYQYRKLLSLSKAINASKDRPFFVLGGHGPSPEPEYFLTKTQADAVIIGEGEVTVVQLMKALENNSSLDTVHGIAFRNEEGVTVNKRQSLIQDVDDIPFPEYSLFKMDIYKLARAVRASETDFVLNMVAGRGCKYRCNFCYRMDHGLRMRHDDSIIEEMALLNKDYGITYILLYDELLMSSEERVIEFSESIIRHGLKVKWYCNGRLNYATDEVIKAMKSAGCVFINYGIECFDDEILHIMKKRLTTDEIVKGIDATLRNGVTPGLNVIFGNIGETRETLKKSLNFLMTYNDWAEMRTIRPVTPYPGSPLYYHAIQHGLLEGPEDFYENKHINSDLLAVNFTDLTDEEFHSALSDANAQLIGEYYNRQKDRVVKQSIDLYANKDVSFRGWRQT